MGTVISFPEARRYTDGRVSAIRERPATIIILPVIRIERYDVEPGDRLQSTPPLPGRKRRPRASRS